MSQFSLVAMGGTFDIIHRGHITLLSNAFEISNKVIIGLTSDEFAQKRGKTVSNNYEKRLTNLTEIIFKEFPNSSFQISKLDNDFGPAVLEPEVEALVVSDETSSQGDTLNDLRAQKNLSPVKVITVPMHLAKDGSRISTTRIKNSEIDSEGNLLSVDK
ncbi:phosphopantetheine adenylyltransferase [Nitrosopumilus sp.]|uniref:phosphopantetheine adenylyltransferase n=1 Tax=Nitrosopumilus sp. TaxID=2024843 RepID=UPI003D0C89DC